MGFAENDDILSEILDGLIEFQEKSPVARTADPVGGNQFQPENQISSIEKYLASTERTVLTPPGKKGKQDSFELVASTVPSCQIYLFIYLA